MSKRGVSSKNDLHVLNASTSRRDLLQMMELNINLSNTSAANYKDNSIQSSSCCKGSKEAEPQTER